MGDRRKPTDRRERPDRRRGDRRRGVDLRRPVFEVCRSMLHLALVIEGENGEASRVVTRSLQWRRKSKSIHTDQGAAELSEAFYALVAEEKLTGASVRIALNGELCVTRVVSGTVDRVRRELGEYQERSQFYLSLGPGRKAVATSVRQLDVRHQHGLLTVANHRTLELLVTIAEKVGIRIAAIEPSLFALVRAHTRLARADDEPCIIIQIDERGAELGLCHEGRLLLDYRPGGRAASASVAAITAEHLGRLERYLNHQHGYTDARLSRVYLTGAPGPVELARAKFAEIKQLQASVLHPKQLETGWQHIGDPPGTELTAALGSALAFATDDAELRGPNLMDHLIAESRAPMQPILMRSAIPLAAVLLVAVALAGYNFIIGRSVAKMEADLARLAPVQLRAKELRLSLGAANAKIEHLQDIDRRLSRPNWPHMISRIAQSLPNDVWLDRVRVSDSSVGSLSGASHSDDRVYDLLGYLEKVPELQNVVLEGTGLAPSISGPTTSFELAFAVAGSTDRNDGASRND